MIILQKTNNHNNNNTTADDTTDNTNRNTSDNNNKSNNDDNDDNTIGANHNNITNNKIPTIPMLILISSGPIPVDPCKSLVPLRAQAHRPMLDVLFALNLSYLDLYRLEKHILIIILTILIL